MEIKTVKKCGKGYLVNDTQLVLTETEDSMVHVKEWLKTNEAKEEFTDEEIQKQELLVKITEAKQYLAKTDHKFYNWYKPKECDDLVEIERLRDEAREFIRANKGDE